MRGRPQSIREEQILDAARDVFRRDGHATTTARIAARAGVSEGILFYRYKSKEALLAAVIHRETQPPNALRELASTAGEHGLTETLERVVATLLESVLRAHPFIELAMTSAASNEVHRILFSKPEKPPPERAIELVAHYLDAEMKRGRMRALDPMIPARAIHGACIEYARSSHMTGSTAVQQKAFARTLVDVLLHGAANPARAKRQR